MLINDNKMKRPKALLSVVNSMWMKWKKYEGKKTGQLWKFAWKKKSNAFNGARVYWGWNWIFCVSLNHINYNNNKNQNNGKRTGNLDLKRDRSLKIETHTQLKCIAKEKLCVCELLFVVDYVLCVLSLSSSLFFSLSGTAVRSALSILLQIFKIAINIFSFHFFFFFLLISVKLYFFRRFETEIKVN